MQLSTSQMDLLPMKLLLPYGSREVKGKWLLGSRRTQGQLRWPHNAWRVGRWSCLNASLIAFSKAGYLKCNGNLSSKNCAHSLWINWLCDWVAANLWKEVRRWCWQVGRKTRVIIFVWLQVGIRISAIETNALMKPWTGYFSNLIKEFLFHCERCHSLFKA